MAAAHSAPSEWKMPVYQTTVYQVGRLTSQLQVISRERREEKLHLEVLTQLAES